MTTAKSARRRAERLILRLLTRFRDACRTSGGTEMSILIAAASAGLAILLAAGAVATSRALALLGAVAVAGLAVTALLACSLARRGRPRVGLLLLAGSLVATGALLGFLYRWPLVGPYTIILAFGLLLPHLRPVERARAILLAVPLVTLLVLLASPDPSRPTAVMAGPLGQLGAGLVVGLVLLILERARSAVEAERERYRSLVEGAPVGIVRVDPSGQILHANEAAARLFGYEAGPSLEGRSILDHFAEPDAARTLAARLRTAGTADGEVELRRADGTIFLARHRTRLVRFEEPEEGAVGFEGIFEDVSDLRRLERELDRIVAERTAVLDALRRIQASPSLEATADAIARELSLIDGFTGASVLVFEPQGRVRPVSHWFAGERWRPLGSPAGARAAELLARAAAGPWVEAVEGAPRDSIRAFLAERGIGQLVYAPLSLGSEPVGLLVLGLPDTDRSAALERLPAAAEFAAVASALLGPSLAEERRTDAVRARIRAILEGRAFSTVFQPIVDLGSGVAFGFEALTRFGDGSPPDRVFADAAACGLGRDLELATLTAALEAAAPLPANAFLAVNVSVDLVLTREPLATILRRAGWGAVLEISEHAPIADYDAFRTAVAALGPEPRLAVDDAGAGHASLRHILELRPAFVKLDRWLVAGIDGDRSRQALVAGMVHAAEGSGYRLVAEGIEREEERRALLELGVRLGQGYLLGRPAAAETWARPAPAERLRPVLASLGVPVAEAVRSSSRRLTAAPTTASSTPRPAPRGPSGRSGRSLSSGGGRGGRGDTPDRG